MTRARHAYKMSLELIDVIERGPSSRLPKKVDGRKSFRKKVQWRRSDREGLWGEGPTEKVQRRRSVGEGLREKVRRRRSAGEGLSEKVRARRVAGEGLSKKVRGTKRDVTGKVGYRKRGPVGKRVVPLWQEK